MRYLLAANLRNNQDLMPHWIHQLLLVGGPHMPQVAVPPHACLLCIPFRQVS
jgi:hypothetical protein